MSNFLKKTKRAWEENEYDANRRQYPNKVEDAYFPNPEAMFPAHDLQDAYEFYLSKVLPEHRSALGLFRYLYKLEKGVPLDKQTVKP